MPRELFIVGTSGLSKEAAQLARRIDRECLRWSRINYVTHMQEELGRAMPFGEITSIDEDLAVFGEPADVVIGVGHPQLRRRIAERLSGNPALDFPNLVHPGVEIDPELVQLGRGNMITQGVVMTCDIRVGDFNLLNWNSTIGHDTFIGSYNVINPGSSVSGRVHIGDACLLGTGCRILETLEIASEVTIGGGAVVIRSITHPGTWVGVPARQVKQA